MPVNLGNIFREKIEKWKMKSLTKKEKPNAKNVVNYFTNVANMPINLKATKKCYSSARGNV